MNINRLKYIIGICKIYIGIIFISLLIAVVSLMYLDDTWKSITIGAVITIVTTCIIEMRAKYERNIERLIETQLQLVKLQSELIQSVTDICDAKGGIINNNLVNRIQIMLDALNKISNYLLFDNNSPLMDVKDLHKINQLSRYIAALIADLQSIKINCTKITKLEVEYKNYLKSNGVIGVYMNNDYATYLCNFYITVLVGNSVNFKVGAVISMLQEIIVNIQTILYRGNTKHCYELMDMVMVDNAVQIY